MTFSQRSHEGYLLVDHRASPGMDINPFRCDGIEDSTATVREGQTFEAPTLGCPHCAAVVVMNPKRTRQREFCFHCNRYICDICGAVSRKSGYIHRSFMEVADMVRSGKYILSGGTASEPILTPKVLTNG